LRPKMGAFLCLNARKQILSGCRESKKEKKSWSSSVIIHKSLYWVSPFSFRRVSVNDLGYRFV
ncbi:MAG: hypothetical protein U0L02_06110, partial [Kandleria vitulina]|uniref:hypothetical protein n=1 Tax=Kandleria vitulina TaxID=1630 RepID=UPI002E795048